MESLVFGRGLLDRLGQSSNAYRAEHPFGGGKSNVPVGFGSAEEDQNHPNDPISESDSGVLKGGKMAISSFWW